MINEITINGKIDFPDLNSYFPTNKNIFDINS